jgi:hypothetical protein
MKYYIRNEVYLHNRLDNCWVIINDTVFDLTAFFKMREDSMNSALEYLVAFAGKDISIYFDDNSCPLRSIDQYGREFCVLPAAAEKTPMREMFWWQDPIFFIGKLTEQARNIRIINTLTMNSFEITVCEEDTIEQIQDKFLRYNSNCKKYTWRKGPVENEATILNLFLTLTQNGIEEDAYTSKPAIWLFYDVEDDDDNEFDEPDDGNQEE